MRLVGGEQPRRWDDLAWRQALRASGLLVLLTRSEYAVLWFAYDLAERQTGEMDLPRGYMAEQLGMSPKAARSAVQRLEGERGLLVAVGRSRVAKGVNRYQLAWPGAVPASIDAVESRSTKAEGGKWASPQGGSGLPSRGEVGFPQSKELKEEVKQAAVRADSQKKSSDRGLFDPLPAYDRAAAAVFCSMGIPSKTSIGLAVQYRVSRSEARNVRSNVRARKASGYAVHNLAGFVRSLLKRGDVSIEGPVQAMLDGRRGKRVAASRRAEAAVQAKKARLESDGHARAVTEAEQRYGAMSPADRAELHAQVSSGLTTGTLLKRPPAGLVKQWAIEELAKAK